MLERVRAKVKETGLSIAEIIRRALDMYLEKRGK
jgi:hypothetical protein